jgi:hypothetical protein
MQTVTDPETGEHKRVEVTKQHRLLEKSRISCRRPDVRLWLKADQNAGPAIRPLCPQKRT